MVMPFILILWAGPANFFQTWPHIC